MNPQDNQTIKDNNDSIQNIGPAPSQVTQPIVSKTRKHKYLSMLLIFLLCEFFILGGAILYFWQEGKAIEQRTEDYEIIIDLKQQVIDLESALEECTVNLNELDF